MLISGIIGSLGASLKGDVHWAEVVMIINYQNGSQRGTTLFIN
jgi:hypothetical protein